MSFLPCTPAESAALDRAAALARARRDYRIVRFYREAGVRRRVIADRLTLEEAQAHCNGPETSSSTATNAVATRRTHTIGAWFDGYESY